MTKLTITLDIDAKELYLQRLLLAYLEQFDIDEYPVDGLLNLTDFIADELAENGDDKALLNGSSQENELGTRMVDALRQTLSADLAAALTGLLWQCRQMEGMFPDEDGTIAKAMGDAEKALSQAYTRLP